MKNQSDLYINNEESNFIYNGNNAIINFYNDENKKLGELDFSGNVMKFEGNAEESAKIFFKYVSDLFDLPKKELNG